MFVGKIGLRVGMGGRGWGLWVERVLGWLGDLRQTLMFVYKVEIKFIICSRIKKKERKKYTRYIEV
jgi:hypothetical protein